MAKASAKALSPRDYVPRLEEAPTHPHTNPQTPNQHTTASLLSILSPLLSFLPSLLSSWRVPQNSNQHTTASLSTLYSLSPLVSRLSHLVLVLSSLRPFTGLPNPKSTYHGLPSFLSSPCHRGSAGAGGGGEPAGRAGGGVRPVGGGAEKRFIPIQKKRFMPFSRAVSSCVRRLKHGAFLSGRAPTGPVCG